jgi:hypothetical protein
VEACEVEGGVGEAEAEFVLHGEVEVVEVVVVDEEAFFEVVLPAVSMGGGGGRWMDG